MRVKIKGTMSKVFADSILQGKVAFVTGGATGITGGVARAFFEHGARLAITSRKEENLVAKRQYIEENGGECFTVASDVRDHAAVENAINAAREHFGKIDIVVNGAAGNFLAPAAELSANGFGTVLDIDTKGTFNVCRAAFDALKESRGQIINISATLHYLATPMQIHVSAAKAGVDAITRNLAVEWGRYGIRVNGIAPGPIEDTEGMKRLLMPELRDKLMRKIPAGRFGKIEDIENAALFLASDAANYVNGETLIVDGGAWLLGTSLT
ncbi:MAG: short-chain alcohol dehydrogenase [Acidobacteria bacterium OLB17]|nr:MAG: short-chain alcohol dehydrogenase [Acidobacteria bacterium OLB17]